MLLSSTDKTVEIFTMIRNLPEAEMSRPAREVLSALLRGEVVVMRNIKTRSEAEPEGKILIVQEGLVSVGRTLYPLCVLKELQQRELVDDHGDLTPEASGIYFLCRGKARRRHTFYLNESMVRA